MSKGGNAAELSRTPELLKAEAELIRARGRSLALQTVTKWVALAVCIGVTTAPLVAIQGIIKPLAGRTTDISATLPISLVLSVSVLGNLAQFVLTVTRKHSMELLRERSDTQEKLLGLSSE